MRLVDLPSLPDLATCQSLGPFKLRNGPTPFPHVLRLLTFTDCRFVGGRRRKLAFRAAFSLNQSKSKSRRGLSHKRAAQLVPRPLGWELSFWLNKGPKRFEPFLWKGTIFSWEHPPKWPLVVASIPMFSDVHQELPN